jgi:NADH dehydrogenase (ubiquinone) 1 alpha subcomplex subunit 9
MLKFDKVFKEKRRNYFNITKIPKRNITLDLKNPRCAGGLIVTIFGATGFIGRYVVNKLARSGAQIVLPYRGEENSYNHLKVCGEVGQIIPIKYHIKDRDLIDKALSQSNIVINMLGAFKETSNFSFEDVHVEAAALISSIVKKHDIKRFIHFSTVNADINSFSKWSRTKAEGELIVRSTVEHATIIRPTWVFGAEDRLINSFMRMVTSIFPFMLLNEKTKFQPVYAVDIASAVLAVLGDSSSYGKQFDLAGPYIYSYGDFTDYICEIFNREVIYIPEFMKLFHEFAIFIQEKKIIPIFTRDQLIFLLKDWIAPLNSLGFSSLGLNPTPLTEFIVKPGNNIR